MPVIPDESRYDRTLAMLREGYRFIGARCARYGSDIVRSRLMFRPVTLICGAQAAEMFYAPGNFTRSGAMPRSVVTLLQDFGSVQMLEGAAHTRRKALFREIFTPAAAHDLARRVGEALWRRWLDVPSGWHFVLFDETRDSIGEALCAWAGIAIAGEELAMRSTQLARTVGNAGKIGPDNWRSRVDRAWLERWARRLVDEVRRGGRKAPPESALARIAAWRDEQDVPLDLPSAAVELINVLRPAVAVAWFVAHLGKFLHECGPPTDRSDEGLVHYVQEVRRLTPFFPFIGGKALSGARLGDYHFAEGEWVLLDLYGTNRDGRVWDEPSRFRPERFARRSPQAPGFVAQGAGDAAVSHRCPGEGATDAILKSVLELLLRMDFEVPAQDLSVNLAAMPPLPRSGFVMVKR